MCWTVVHCAMSKTQVKHLFFFVMTAVVLAKERAVNMPQYKIYNVSQNCNILKLRFKHIHYYCSL